MFLYGGGGGGTYLRPPEPPLSPPVHLKPTLGFGLRNIFPVFYELGGGVETIHGGCCTAKGRVKTEKRHDKGGGEKEMHVPGVRVTVVGVWRKIQDKAIRK